MENAEELANRKPWGPPNKAVRRRKPSLPGKGDAHMLKKKKKKKRNPYRRVQTQRPMALKERKKGKKMEEAELPGGRENQKKTPTPMRYSFHHNTTQPHQDKESRSYLKWNNNSPFF